MFKKLSILLIAVALAGCGVVTNSVDPLRGLAPQSVALVDKSAQAGASSNSPVLIRIFKATKELELWRLNKNGRYALVHTYEICAFSGDVGPKIKQGDYQAPEGFYTIVPRQMNYNSIRYLAADTGYPNQFDRDNKRTGSAVMIHGGCDSAGCFAIKDAPMQDLFAAMRDAFKGGQKSIQVHIYPFRMTAINMLFNSKNKNIDFWRQLETGYDIFESAHKELNIAVVNQRYVVK
jgi:murein L,D-transpeptidase YafK